MAKKTRRSNSSKSTSRTGARPRVSKKPAGTDARKPEARQISKPTKAPDSGAQTQFIGAPIVDPSVIAGPVIEPKKAAPKPVPRPEPVADATPAAAAAAPAQAPKPKPAASAPAPKSKPKTPPAKAAAPQGAPKSQGLVGGVIGGVIAAAIGFGAAQVYPDGWPIGTSEEVETAVAAQSGQIDTLTAELAALSATASDTAAVDALSAQIAALSAQVAQAETAIAEAQNAIAVARDGLTARMDALTTDLTERVATLEKAPIEQAADAAVAVAVEAYQAEVTALRDETRANFDALSAELQARLGEGNAAIVEALEANQRLQAERANREAAARAAEAAAVRAQAMTNLRTALDKGASFDAPLQVLTDAPGPLPALASDGIPTAMELSEAFPSLARSALTVALREASAGSMEDRAMTFFRTQLGIRSLTPQDGEDPDAVLSRMEAAVSSGDYETTLAEAAALPEAARAVLADWLDDVETRRAALAAADALAAQMNTN